MIYLIIPEKRAKTEILSHLRFKKNTNIFPSTTLYARAYNLGEATNITEYAFKDVSGSFVRAHDKKEFKELNKKMRINKLNDIQYIMTLSNQGVNILENIYKSMGTFSFCVLGANDPLDKPEIYLEIASITEKTEINTDQIYRLSHE